MKEEDKSICIVCSNLLHGWEALPHEKHRHLKIDVQPTTLHHNVKCENCADTGNMSAEKDTVFIACNKCNK